MQLAYANELSYNDRMSALLDRVDYRLAVSKTDREAIFRLRYEAYRREKSIAENPSEMFCDEYDETGLVKLFGVYIDDKLVSSIRVHIANSSTPFFPSLGPFRDILQPELDAGKTVIDPTRFVIDKEASREFKGLPHLTLRLGWLAAEHYNAEHFLVAIRVEHQAFYRRTFQHQIICEAREYPLLAAPISLMTVSREVASKHLQRKYPFYRSSSFERRMLFDDPVVPVQQPAARDRHLTLVESERMQVVSAG